MKQIKAKEKSCEVCEDVKATMTDDQEQEWCKKDKKSYK